MTGKKKHEPPGKNEATVIEQQKRRKTRGCKYEGRELTGVSNSEKWGGSDFEGRSVGFSLEKSPFEDGRQKESDGDEFEESKGQETDSGKAGNSQRIDGADHQRHQQIRRSTAKRHA